MGSKPTKKMDREERAKQFMPFAALRGLDEALAKKEKIVVPKKELSEEMLAELDQQIHTVEKGKLATVVYYKKDEYLKVTGMVARIDETARILQIVNEKISFDDILEIAVQK